MKNKSGISKHMNFGNNILLTVNKQIVSELHSFNQETDMFHLTDGFKYGSLNIKYLLKSNL